ncbi:10005_t:CDS:2, partial [Entrophospora sp. SA101]
MSEGKAEVQSDMKVSAIDKTTGRSNMITITNYKERLSREEIEQMDDEKVAQRITARNELESYAYNLHSTLQDKEISIKIDPDDKKELEDAIQNTIRWLDNNQEAERYQYEDRKQLLEETANPIMMKLYSQRNFNG